MLQWRMGRRCTRLIEKTDPELANDCRHRQLEPKIAHASPLRRKVFERIQAVKMIDRQVKNQIRRGKPEIDGHAPATILFKPQSAPA